MTQERYCCDGGCNENQGRGACPSYRNPPTETEWLRVDLLCAVLLVSVVGAIALGWV